jgi:hypothetical protein
MNPRFLLVVCFFFSSWLVSSGHGQELSIAVSEDSWIEVGAGANFGGATDLAICPNAGYWIYLKFDLAGIDGTILDVRLEMKRFSGSRPEEISAYGIDDDTWTEAGIAGDALPPPGDPAAATTLAMGTAGEASDSWQSTLLTAFVQEQATGDGVASLMVREDPSNNFDVRRYFSREGARTAAEVPQLILQIETGPVVAPESLGAEWRAVDIGAGSKPSFDFGADGSIHIMGMTELQSGVVWHASAPTADGPWEPQPVATGYFYGPGDLVVASDGTAHLTWHNHLQEDANHVAVPTLGDPILRRIETPNSHDGWDSALALGADGSLHQSSVNPSGFGASTSLQHSVFDGQSWAPGDVPGSGPFMYGLNTSIAIDRDGHPHIAYCSATDFRSPGELRYAYRTADGWTVTPPVTSGPVVGRFPSLALDHWDRPHIAWLDGDAADESLGTVRYAVFNNDAWQVEELDVMQDVELSFFEARKSVSLALDRLWQPHVAFGDRRVVKYARKVFGEWQIETAIEQSEPIYKGLVVLRLSPTEAPGIVFWQGHPELPGVVRFLSRSEFSSAGGQIPGDCTGDAVLNISDPVCLLERLFSTVTTALPCAGEDTGAGGNGALFDASGDDRVDLTDAVSILGFLFLGGPPHTLGTECVSIADCDPVCVGG